MQKVLFLIVIIILSFSSCIEIPNQFSAVPPGIWRGVLKLDESPVMLAEGAEEYVEKVKRNSDAELPFNFEIKYTNDTTFNMIIHNGSERLVVDDIAFGRDNRIGRDTLLIDFPLYDSYIRAYYEEHIIEGDWIVKSKKDYKIPFIAYHGNDSRFINSAKPTEYDLNGKWETMFAPNTDDAYPAIGEFKQVGNKITGTFRTETGDFRFLEGIIEENKFYLSCFDGSHAFFFSGKFISEDELTGVFRSGKHYQTTWSAKRNNAVELADEYNMTKMLDDQTLDFEFINTNGKIISLRDEQYEGKAKLVKIMGTWCPNCRDEMNFLLDYYPNKPKNLEIIAVSFERYRDTSKVLQVLNTYKEKLDIPFQLLYGGNYRKAEASESFPMLNKIISYPTLLYVNADNEVIHIYTGFNGPATSKFEEFEKSFKEKVAEILPKQ